MFVRSGTLKYVDSPIIERARQLSPPQRIKMLEGAHDHFSRVAAIALEIGVPPAEAAAYRQVAAELEQALREARGALTAA